MLLDHIAVIIIFSLLGSSPWLLPVFTLLRTVGRLSFPIFCFLLSEGFRHTKSRKRYFLRLACFAVISEIPFNLAYAGTVYCSDKQNIFFTLAAALVTLCAFERFKNSLPLKIAATAAGCAVSLLLNTDYAVTGIIIPLMFYISSNNADRLFLAGSVAFFDSLQFYGAGILSLIPISFYNQKRGNGSSLFFYLFYPLHFIALLFIKHIMSI
ncbi:MAG: hypothetical protein IKV41_04770 [Oscillospiraceae bacterium]|nr:hypothetical protein [Oscillospiraceae bacterium]